MSSTFQHLDYYPFGMLIQERSYTATAKGYRFGFNGQEQDDELSGSGNSYTATFWQYDSRIGRRFNVDPLYNTFPGISTYACLNNNPNIYIDKDGNVFQLATVGAGALLGGIVGGVIGAITAEGDLNAKLKGAGRGFLIGTVSGAIAGTGVGFAQGMSGFAALATTTAGFGASGYAGSIIGQGLDLLEGKRDDINQTEAGLDALIAIPIGFAFQSAGKYVSDKATKGLIGSWNNNRLEKLASKENFNSVKLMLKKQNPSLNKRDLTNYTKKTITAYKEGYVKEGETLAFFSDKLGAFVLGATESISSNEIDENIGEEDDDKE